MNQKAVLRGVILAVACGLVAPIPVLADDAAASIAAGGLVPRRETRIVMAKEVLRISEKKVVVDYDFRNDSDQDVTTEVAFPVPPYSFEDQEEDRVPGQSFSDFRLYVDGKSIPFEIEAKATLKGRDITDILVRDSIDIPSFGHFKDTRQVDRTVFGSHALDLDRLPESEQERLVALGIFKFSHDDSNDETVDWTVHLQYHWTQTFPAHTTIHIRHEYTPIDGFTPLSVLLVAAMVDPENVQKQGQLDDNIKDQLRNNALKSSCAEPAFLRTVLRDVISSFPVTHPDNLEETGEIEFEADWVDFILTSANTWQRPIEDFTLIVERPQPEQTGKTLISFCSPANGKVERLDADHLQVHLTNFIPASELHIGFFLVPMAKPAQPVAKK